MQDHKSNLRLRELLNCGTSAVCRSGSGAPAWPVGAACGVHCPPWGRPTDRARALGRLVLPDQ